MYYKSIIKLFYWLFILNILNATNFECLRRITQGIVRYNQIIEIFFFFKPRIKFLYLENNCQSGSKISELLLVSNKIFFLTRGIYFGCSSKYVIIHESVACILNINSYLRPASLWLPFLIVLRGGFYIQAIVVGILSFVLESARASNVFKLHADEIHESQINNYFCLINKFNWYPQNKIKLW